MGDNVLCSIQKEGIEQILDSIGEGAILFNVDKKAIYYNIYFKEMFNLEGDLLQEKGLDYLKEYFSSMLLNPEPYLAKSAKFLANKSQFSEEISFKSGRLFNVLVTPIRVYNINCILCSFNEKTKEREYKESLKECYEIFEKLIDNIPDIIILHDNLKCIYINSTGSKLLGYNNQKDIQGMDMKRFLTRDAVEVLKHVEFDTQRGIDIENSLELKVIDKDKNPLWLELMSCTRFVEEKDIELSILRDITKKKQVDEMEKLIIKREEALAEQKKKHKFKYDFYTNMSHEAKTPINVILAASRMLRMEIKEESLKGEEYIEIINKNCNKMIREINDFIDIEKIQTGYFTTNPEKCDVIKTIEDITLSFLPYTNEKNIELIFDTEVEERIAEVDIYLLERVLLNLLSNAVKFTNPGGKVLVFTKDLGPELEISIRDTGIGISQENLIHIFEKFRQVHRTGGLSRRGSGLGLYLVKNILRMMGGKIFIKSEEGVGSTFTVIIPAQPIEIENHQ